jgi:hypothetical protein
MGRDQPRFHSHKRPKQRKKCIRCRRKWAAFKSLVCHQCRNELEALHEAGLS